MMTTSKTILTLLALALVRSGCWSVNGKESGRSESETNPYEGQPSKGIKLDRPIPTSSPLCKNATVSETDIARDIFGRHKAWERPLIKATKPIEIEIRLVLSSINDVLEREKILKLTGYLLFYWYDEFHVWNTTFPHACLSTVVMPQKDVWIPEVAMINSEQHYELLLMHNEEMVRMYANGYASYRPGGTFRAYCDFDLRYFPFDEQTCVLTMESWRYTVDFQLFHFGDTIQRRYWIENEQWKLANASQRISNVQYVTNNVFCRVEFELQLQRKVGYYTINVIVPSVIISIAQIGTFTLPVDEVMKIHISFTCLLAYGVFQLMIIEDIPRTSDRIPLLCYYIALSMAYICLAMLGEGLVFVSVRKGSDKRHKHYVPGIVFNVACVIGKFLDIKRPMLLLEDKKDPSHPETHMSPERLLRYQTQMDDNPYRSVLELKDPEHDMSELQRKQQLQLKEIEERKTHHDAEIDRQHRWEFVADVLDRLVLITYVLLIFFTPIAMFVIIPSQTRKL